MKMNYYQLLVEVLVMQRLKYYKEKNIREWK